MGAYSKVKENVFTGATGRELRRHPAEVREVQFWLLAGPGRDPFGIFIFEPAIVAPAIGRTEKKIRESLQVLIDLGFCKWDDATQFVWVIEMAHHQFDAPLKLVDKRCVTAQKWYAAAPRNPFLGEWFDRYVDDFHLTKGEHAVERREWAERPGSDAPSHAPSKGLVLSVLSEEGSLFEETRAREPQPPAPIDPQAPLKGGQIDEAFERVWKVYPNACERKEARSQFGRLKPTPALIDTMLRAIETQQRGDRWMRGYIPKLANWFKDHRWHDKVQIAGGGSQPQLTDRNAKNIGAGQRFLERRRGGQP